ncbi:hypothetical protein LTR15_004678 [Elasticomyces elasticus]|nr:hypothetical protein LTR15_004678 [Elasticomyces elasticus]
MSRMTRSGIKHEPGMEDLAIPTFSPSNTANMANGTASRAVSVASRSVTSRITPAFEVPVMSSASRATTMQDTNTASSGNTTLADEDIEMNGCAHSMLETDHHHHTGLTSFLGSSTEEDAMQVLGRHSRVLINAVRKLSLLAIDTTLPSLPTFVVVGDQSAGKSSIVEAICDITVPRDQGTCTRCPFQITTSATTTGESWTCKVSLHHTHQYDSTYRAGNDVTKYDYWRKMRDMTCDEFDTIRNKNDLQKLLYRAQLAILHPGTDPKEFLHDGHATGPGVGFSPNIVSILIEGPDLPELSFFDLPGAINVHADGENHLVFLVEKLIKSCTGVLTKPDLVGVKRFALLQRILTGEKFKLGSADAWFVTKQLSQDELDAGRSRYEAQELEKSFFLGQPWNTTLMPYFDRFGTPQLQLAVSRQLTQHILRELPDIAARVQARLDTVNGRLKGLPTVPASASHTVMDEARALTSSIETHIRGEGMHKEFRNDYKGIMRGLRENLKARRPTIKLGSPGYVKPLVSINLEDMNDDDDDATPVQSPDPTPSKKRKITSKNSNNSNSQPSRSMQTPSYARTAQMPRSGRPKANAHDTASLATTFDLGMLTDMYTYGSISDLPDQLNPRVTEEIIAQWQHSWNVVVAETLDSVKLRVGDMLRNSLDDSLVAKRNTTLFYFTTRDALTTFFNGLWDEEYTRIIRLLQCEQHKPLTYTHLSPQIDAVTEKLKSDRLTERINEYYDTLDAKGFNVPFGDAERQKKRADLQETVLKADKYDGIIGVVASALAYYDHSSGHLIDSIAKEVQFGLLFAMERDLYGILRAELRATDEAHCAHLLAPDPAQEAQRVILQAEKERLTKALEELKGLPQITGV